MQKSIVVPSGQSVRLAEMTGAGRVVRIWFTLPLLGQRHALRQLVLRMFWDGESEPSVEVPLGDFFGASFGRPRRLVSESVNVVGGAYLSRFVMPFNSSALIELRNDADSDVGHVFYQIDYVSEPERRDAEPTLHACFQVHVPAERSAPLELLHVLGQGRFAGLILDLENLSWWLKPPISHIPLPRGFGLGLLEGWETVVIDDDVDNALVGTGAEDYFSSGFYFMGAPFCTPSYGCTYRSFFKGRVSAYRFHENGDAFMFNRSFKFLLDHGLQNRMAGRYYSTAFWYQHEPHVPFSPLPSMAARRVRLPWVNPIQWILIGASMAIVVGLAYYGLAAWLG